MCDESVPSQDPLDLDALRVAKRTNEQQERVDEPGMPSCFESDEASAENQRFLQEMDRLENGPWTTQFEELVREGVELPPPEVIDDAAVHSKIWEIVNVLAARKVFLYHTDHLSDRQLYEELWGDALREGTVIMPRDSGWRNHIDILGGCSQEDIALSLRYYMSEKERRFWAEDFPDDVIPPHEDPPFDRDRLLPIADDECFEDGAAPDE